MNKVILLVVVLVGFMFAGMQSECNNVINQSNVEKYQWVSDSSDDGFKADAGRRRGKGNRGRRRGGNGLR